MSTPTRGRPSPRPRGSARRKTASSLILPWPLLISDVGLELEGTLINCSLL